MVVSNFIRHKKSFLKIATRNNGGLQEFASHPKQMTGGFGGNPIKKPLENIYLGLEGFWRELRNKSKEPKKETGLHDHVQRSETPEIRAGNPFFEMVRLLKVMGLRRILLEMNKIMMNKIIGAQENQRGLLQFRGEIMRRDLIDVQRGKIMERGNRRQMKLNKISMR